MTNTYGLDVRYFTENLGMVVRDCEQYSPQDMANELRKYADVAEGEIPDKVKSLTAIPPHKMHVKVQFACVLELPRHVAINHVTNRELEDAICYNIRIHFWDSHRVNDPEIVDESCTLAVGILG